MKRPFAILKRLLFRRWLVIVVACVCINVGIYAALRSTSCLEFRQGKIFAMHLDGGCRATKYYYVHESKLTPNFIAELYSPLLYAEFEIEPEGRESLMTIRR
ncbi:MAG: hypothetical protein V3W41_11995 [Planctomycetota bacterium]